tara:strand:- start:4438 stop:5217 length:780 start_codon:yes stop_codon:yes gene_type:complete
MGQIADKFVFPLADNRAGSDATVESIVWLERADDYSIPIKVLTPATFSDVDAILVYSHGNGETMLEVVPFLQEVSTRLNVEVWSWEYAGYGPHKTRNPDVSPNEENVYTDAEFVTNLAGEQAEELGVPLIVWGRSLGSAPAIHTARMPNISGLIVESGFRSCIRVIRPAWVGRSLHSIFDRFDNEKEQQEIPAKVPTLYVHGKQDCVVPFEHGHYLYTKSTSIQKECYWISHGTHNNIDSSYQGELLIRVKHFIAKRRR